MTCESCMNVMLHPTIYNNYESCSAFGSYSSEGIEMQNQNDSVVVGMQDWNFEPQTGSCRETCAAVRIK